MRTPRVRRSTGTLAIAGLLCGLVAVAQDEDDGAADEEIDEIVVIVDRSGDPVLDVELRNEEILREKILKEYFRLQQLEDEAAWRQADPDLKPQNVSRIKWGYNPQAEARMRRDTALTDLPIDNNKPATIFRIEF